MPPRSLPGLLLVVLALLPSPAAALRAEGEVSYFVDAALRADVLAADGRATFRHSPALLGTPGLAFDGKSGTVLRLRGEPAAFLEVAFRERREVDSFQAWFGGNADHEWSLLAGEDPAALAVIAERRRTGAGAWSRVEEPVRPVAARVFRVVVRRLDGVPVVDVGEIALRARQRPVALDLEAPSTVVTRNGSVRVRTRVTFDGGYRAPSARGLSVVAPRDACVRVAPLLHEEGVTVHHLKEGRSPLVARLRAREGWLESPPLEFEARDRGLPDWSAGWIERTPRLPHDGSGGGVPAPGSAVVLVAHVRNYGTVDAPRVPYLWQVDGEIVERGHLEGIDRFREGTVSLRLAETGRRRTVRFVVDPGSAFEETGEGNNEVSLETDALRLGIWVENPVFDRFHRTQPSFGDGAAGFEDWAQRQVRRWNALLAAARGPLAPEGLRERVALDLVVAAEEGALPLAAGTPSNDPDAGDRSVDLQVGFPATRLLDPAFRGREGDRSAGNPLWLDDALLRDLSRARYLADHASWNVAPAEVALRDAFEAPVAGSPALPLVAPGLVHRTASVRLMAGDAAGGYGPLESSALRRIEGLRARGGNRNPPPEIGEYLGDLPRTCGIRVLAADGLPLDGVEVRAWRRGPGAPRRFEGEPVRAVVTTGGGACDLSRGGEDPFFEGRRGGGLDPADGILLLRLHRNGRTRWRFLECAPYNQAFWAGAAGSHHVDLPTDLPR